MSEESLEAPEADALEQDANAPVGEDLGPSPDGMPLEANPADLAEQARDIGPDDDEDYR